jgi:hypothetical protein
MAWGILSLLNPPPPAFNPSPSATAGCNPSAVFFITSNIQYPADQILRSMMGFITLLDILFAWALISKSRFLLPRNVIPHLAGLLNETQQLLDRAKAIGAIPDAEEMRTCLAM